jgi:hypothetical protein
MVMVLPSPYRSELHYLAEFIGDRSERRALSPNSPAFQCRRLSRFLVRSNAPDNALLDVQRRAWGSCYEHRFKQCEGDIRGNTDNRDVSRRAQNAAVRAGHIHLANSAVPTHQTGTAVLLRDLCTRHRPKPPRLRSSKHRPLVLGLSSARHRTLSMMPWQMGLSRGRSTTKSSLRFFSSILAESKAADRVANALTNAQPVRTVRPDRHRAP